MNTDALGRPPAARPTDADGDRELTLVVAAITREAHDVVGLELRDPAGARLPAWQPGAHVDLILDGSLDRQYSLCGDPSEADTWHVAVLREPDSRGGSRFVHDRLQVGDRIDVRGPRNHFPLVEGTDYRIVAGGIGVTPLLPMVEALARRGARWRLLYGGRQRESMAFRERLARLGPFVEICPEEERGLLDLTSFLKDVNAGTRVYVCGPEPLIDAVEALSSGWPNGVLNVERFHPRTGVFDGPNTAFTVVCAEAGLELEIPPDRSIVDVLLDAGIEVPTSCREGTCGTCETFVLEGIPDHRTRSPGRWGEVVGSGAGGEW